MATRPVTLNTGPSGIQKASIHARIHGKKTKLILPTFKDVRISELNELHTLGKLKMHAVFKDPITHKDRHFDRHINEKNGKPEMGGFKENTAKVHRDAYIGPKAFVIDHAIVEKGAEIKDEAEVSGNAHVSSTGKVVEYSRVSGHATVNGMVKGYAYVHGHSIVDGEVGGTVILSGHEWIAKTKIVDTETR